ncbi:MAG: hypothetical protein KBT36_03705 [Kurthia sp.]|nr:hypothetical protein [Candidatus Kurthia equi]
MLKKHLTNECGLSLVEVLAASVLLMIVLISFFSFFISSKNIVVESKKTVTATYSAQSEMEAVYKQVQNTTNITSTMQGLGYTASCSQGQSVKFLKKLSSQQHSFVMTKITPTQGQSNNLVNILISIYDSNKVTITDPCASISNTPTSEMEKIVKEGGSI